MGGHQGYLRSPDETHSRRHTLDMSAFILTVNGTAHTLDVNPGTLLLWVLRDTLELTGTK